MRQTLGGPRSRCVATAALLLALASSARAAVDTLWLRKFWGVDSAAPFIANQVADMCTDARGYVYIAGCGEFPEPTSHRNMLIAKYTQWGDLVWMRGVNGNTYSPNDIAQAVAVDSVGNVWFAGSTRNRFSQGTVEWESEDITWGKIDPAGDFVYVAKLREGYRRDDAAYDIVIGRRGDVYVCGAVGVDTMGYVGSAYFIMRVQPDSGSQEDFVWKRQYVLDPNAVKVPRDRHPDFVFRSNWWNWDNCAAAMDVGPDSCVVLTGFGYHGTHEYEAWTMKFRDSVRVWEDVYHYRARDYDDMMFDVVVASTNYIYVTGSSDNAQSNYDVAVLRYDPGGGTPAQVRIAGSGSGNDYALAIVADDSTPVPNIYVCGYQWVSGNHYQAFVQKYGGGLTARWGANGALFGQNAANDYAYDVAYCSGRVYIAGMAGTDVFVAAYSCENVSVKDTLWSFRWNGPFNDQDLGAAICVTDTNHVYLGGQYGRPSMSGGVSDYSLMRLGYRYVDLAARVLLSPPDTVRLGSTHAPQLSVANVGTVRAQFWSRTTIGSDYSDSVGFVQWLAPGDSCVLTLRDWVAQPPGMLAVRCTVACVNDVNPANDWLRDSVFVAYHDVGCVGIVQPAGAVDSGVSLVPRAWVRNSGNLRESFQTRLVIAPDYFDSAGTSIAAGESALLSFRSWTARVNGVWYTSCSTRLSGDANVANDRSTGMVEVRTTDWAVLGIMSPGALVESGMSIVPKANVANRGSAAGTAWVHFSLDDGSDAVVYRESAQVTLPSGASETLAFPPTQPLVRVGDWVAYARVVVAGDQRSENDTASKPVRIVPPGQSWPRGWVEVDPILNTPTAKAVKDGGWLAVDRNASRFYCGKGNKTGDFYTRAVLGTAWIALTPIPIGVEGKPCSKGAVGACDSRRYVYATKGNNTLGFWRYSIDSLTWAPMPDIPLGPSRKKVKGGTDLLYIVEGDTGWVYLLKGYKNEFFRFNTCSGQWDTTLPPAPIGVNAKWDKGSWLVSDGGRAVYAHKAKYHELWVFDVTTHTWSSTALPGMPFVGMLGKKKKSKDGGCADWYDGAIYGLKGGNTQEFWKYIPATGTWTELETMPAYGSTGKKKRVKAGGDIVYSHFAFWALKGNKTLEFWRYGLDLGPKTSAQPGRSGVMMEPVSSLRQAVFAIQPNPASDVCWLQYSVPRTTGIACCLYDASGRLVRVAPVRNVSGSGALALDVQGLPAGVYLLRLETEAGMPGYSVKLVLR